MIPISVVYEDRIIELDKKLPDYTLLPSFLSKMKEDFNSLYPSSSIINKDYRSNLNKNSELSSKTTSTKSVFDANSFLSSLLISNSTSHPTVDLKLNIKKPKYNIFKSFRKCIAYFDRTPVISYGIIGIYKNNNEKEFLVCQRSNTYEYVEFIRGRYKYSDLFRLFSLMSKKEKEKLLVDDFHLMLSKVISEDDNFSLDDITYAESKFESIKHIIPLLIKNTLDQEILDFFPKGRKLRYGHYLEDEVDYDDVTNQHNFIIENILNLPNTVDTSISSQDNLKGYDSISSQDNLKGYDSISSQDNLKGYDVLTGKKIVNLKSNIIPFQKEKETDLESAVRECKEETGIPKDLTKILIHDKIFYEAFLRSNGRVYITKYYVMLFKDKEEVNDSFETMNVRWAPIDKINCELRMKKILEQVDLL